MTPSIFNTRNAAIILIIVFSVVFLFHLTIILGFTSADSIWGGNIPNDQLIYFEIIALLLLLLFSWITAIKGNLVSWYAPKIILKIGPWIVFTYLIINTAGNLISPGIEKLFSIVTFFLCICAFAVAISKSS